MLNRDIYQLEPSQNRLANNGVAQVKDDLSEPALKTLRYELETFVCDGEYEAGMDKILSQYLRNLNDQHEQPGVWISGFFGSGKSHLAKVLRALWVNQSFPDGANARDIADLPQEIRDHFKELSIEAKRHGGLHAASGTLGSGANNNVRMALLNIIFKSAGLPEEYHQARFIMWLKREGLFEQIKAAVEADGDKWEEEIDDLYMSRSIASALLKADSTLATDIPGMRQLLKDQYPIVTDVTNKQMVDAIIDAISVNGELPLTLIVLDEVQQYVGQDAEKAHQIQEVTETISGHSGFKNKVLFVATGQNALSGMPNLQRLMGRFPTTVQLSDTDVESVIRKVILQKKESAKPQIDSLLKTHLGEISRHLRGTRIEYHRDDEKVMLADYPLLPVRRRFWERVLRIVDTTGTVSQLRNQLKVVHEATQSTADKELGYVVPADFIYDQIANNLLQTGIISKAVSENIGRLKAGDENSQIQSRLLALILLIGKLPTDPVSDAGVRATPDMLADLLIDDLGSGKDQLRTQVPELLEDLASQGLIMAMQTQAGTEYRLQTQESAQWYDTFRQEEATLRGNMQRVENLRIDLLQKALRQQIHQVRLTQGRHVSEARQILIHADAELPRDASEKIYAWLQDGWGNSEKDFLNEARRRPAGDPTIFIFVPARNKSELAAALIAQHAAETTLSLRGIPNTDAGKDARSAMETRKRDAEKHVETLLKEILDGVMVWQAGGADVDGNSISERVETAARASLVRLYREFDVADHAGWSKVYDRARKEGGHNALEAVNHSGDADKHPVCAQIKRYIGVSKTGKEIRDHFLAAPYGWPQDAIDGALYALLAAGVTIAKDSSGRAIKAPDLERKQITQVAFYPENVTISPVDLIKVRGVIGKWLGVQCQSGEESTRLPQMIEKARELAQRAGGEAPYPQQPDTQLFDDIARQSGNAQIKLVVEHQQVLLDAQQHWQEQAQAIQSRSNDWDQLQTLLELSKDLAFYAEINKEAEAIRQNRSLLSNPNPAKPLIQQLVSKLRDAVNHHVQAYLDTHAQQLQQLQANADWQRLTDEQRQQMLAKRNLLTLPHPELSDADTIIDALNDVSLTQWSDRTDSLASKFDSARMEAVQLLQPKVQRIDLPRTTISTETELNAWLDDVKARVLNKLNDGPVTF